MAPAHRLPPEPEYSFDAVLKAAREGQPEALGRLWSTYQGRVHGYLGGLAPDAAEDLCSDVWLGVAKALRNFEGGESEFRAWLFTIAHRRAVDHRRRLVRRPTVGWEDREVPDKSAGPDEVAVEADRADEVRRLVGSLPEDQATAILLRVMGGLSGAEAAAVMGKKPATVRVLTHRGLQRLAGRLGSRTLEDRATVGSRKNPVTPGADRAMAKS